MDQNALLVSILPTTVHSAMATPQDSIQLNVFDPPRPYIVRIFLKPLSNGTSSRGTRTG